MSKAKRKAALIVSTAAIGKQYECRGRRITSDVFSVRSILVTLPLLASTSNTSAVVSSLLWYSRAFCAASLGERASTSICHLTRYSGIVTSDRLLSLPTGRGPLEGITYDS